MASNYDYRNEKTRLLNKTSRTQTGSTYANPTLPNHESVLRQRSAGEIGGMVHGMSSHISNEIEVLNHEQEAIEIPPIIHDGCCGKFFPFGFCYEFRKLVILAIPITITSLVAFLSGPVSLIFCGRLGKTALATAGLANSVFNVCGLSVVTGLLTAVDTVFSQTYGSEHKHLMGIHLQRAFVIMSFCCLPCWSLYLCSEPLLLLMKQNPQVAKESANYLLYMIPGLYFATVNQILVKYVQTQNRVYGPLAIGVFGNCLNAVFHYLLLFVAQVGVRGSAIAQSLAYLCQCLCFIPYIGYLERAGVTWHGWSKDLWCAWGMWFKLALPGIAMTTLEWTIFEIGSIVSGTLGERELATQTILFNIESICFTLLPLGFGIATSIRLGQFLGARCHVGPRSVISVALITLWGTSVVFIIVLILLRRQIPKIFTTDPDVIDLTSTLLPLIAAFQAFDGTVGVCSGAIRGAGLQLLGALICFVTLYLVGAPIGLSLVFIKGTGLEGLWIGMIIGTVLESIVYCAICQGINWEKQVELAAKRTLEGTETGRTIMASQSRQNSIWNSDLSSSTQLISSAHQQAPRPDRTSVRSSESQPLLSQTTPLENEIIESGINRNLVIRRTIFIICMLTILLVTLTLKLTAPWKGKFGIFCIYPNGSFIKINQTSTGTQWDKFEGQFIFIPPAENCTILVP